MKVEVDPEFCQGTGYCVRVCPEVFQLSEDARRAEIINGDLDSGDDDLFERVEEAERLCPSGAITIIG